MQNITYIGENSLSLIGGRQYKLVSSIGEDMIRVIDETGEGYIYARESFETTLSCYPINNEGISTVSSINELLPGNNSSYIDYTNIIELILTQPTHAYIGGGQAESAATSALGLNKKRSVYVKKDIPLAGTLNWYLPVGTMIQKVTVIAGLGKRRKIDEIDRLVENYQLNHNVSTNPKDWSKIAGQALIVNRETQQCAIADVHWYECQNIGRVETKYVKIIRQLPKKKV